MVALFISQASQKLIIAVADFYHRMSWLTAGGFLSRAEEIVFNQLFQALSISFEQIIIKRNFVGIGFSQMVNIEVYLVSLVLIDKVIYFTPWYQQKWSIVRKA